MGCEKCDERDDLLAFEDRVERLSKEQVRKLMENRHRGGWDGETVEWLLGRLKQEVVELETAIRRKKEPAAILSEAADIANFAMMIADNTSFPDWHLY